MGAMFPAPAVGAILAGAILLVAGDSSCPARCVCSVVDELDMSCDLPGGRTITVKGTPGSEITITCEYPDQRFTIEDLPQMEYGRNQGIRLVLNNCPLPSSFELAASKLGARHIEQLYVHYVQGSANVTADLLKGLDQLQRLAFYSSNINVDTVSSALSNLPSLKKLTISSGNVTLRPGDFDSAPNLEYLELSMCNIASLPEGIFKSLRKLKTLNLFRNQLQELTEEQLQGPESLETLDVSNNKLRSLRSVSAAAQSLTILAANGNALEELPQLRNLRNLTKVMIHDNSVPLNITSEALASLPALEIVDLSRSSIASLPANFISGSTSLNTLLLQGNLLTELAEELFKDQKSLETLKLNKNRLSQLNKKVFWPLHALKSLYLDYNNLTSLPLSFISGLSSLVTLNVAHNQLSLVKPPHFNGARSLADIDLSYNNIIDPESAQLTYVEFDGAFSQLPELRRLDLSHNQLTVMPRGVPASAIYLEELNLAHNQIEELYGATFVSNSAVVNLSNNRIKKVLIPEGNNSTHSSHLDNHPRSTLKLDNNPFACDCYMYPLAQRFHKFKPLETTEVNFEINEGRCASPPSLFGRLFNHVPLQDFICNEPDECYDNCTCLFRPYTKALELTCEKPPKKYPKTEGDLGRVALELRLTAIPSTLNITSDIRTLNLSGLGLRNFPTGLFPDNLKVLDLSNNSLSQIPSELFIRNIEKFYISKNPLSCDCWYINDVGLLQDNQWRIEDYDQVNCTSKEQLSQVNKHQLCSTWRASVVGSILAMFGLLTIVAAILILRYSFEIKVWLYTRDMFARWFVIDDDDRKYDAFLSFCHKDEEFVNEHLIPGLENIPQPYKLCVHYRDWMPGQFITTQIAQSVAESRRTIIVVSKNFLESQWARAEFRTANMTAIKERKTRVIAILLEDVNSHKALDPELKAYLSTNTYLKWGDPWFWDKLRYALPHRKADLMRTKEKAKNARANEARKVLGVCGLDTRLTSEGVIINAAALAVPENKKCEQINLDMNKLNNIRSMSDLKNLGQTVNNQ